MIIEVNDTFLGWTGWSREDLVGQRTFAELLSPGGRIYHETHFSPMLRVDGKVQEMALEIVTTARTRIPVLVNALLEDGRDGRRRRRAGGAAGGLRRHRATGVRARAAARA